MMSIDKESSIISEFPSIIHNNVTEKTKQKTFVAYVFAFFISLISSILILKLRKTSWLYIPFHYIGDAVCYGMNIKSLITTGWYLTNPLIGAPEGHIFYDFPMSEGVSYFIIKILSFLSSDWAFILNAFFLLSFPLITISALFVLRRFELSYPFALTASILFAFLPFHWMRGEEHVFLSAYFTVPLIVWLAVLLYQDALFKDIAKKKKQLCIYFLICILIGSSGIYYAYFGSFFMIIGGCIASYKTKQWSPLKYAFLFITIITVSILVNVYPTIRYQLNHGTNPITRSPAESEFYGLKITQLLLPLNQDRIKIFAKLKTRYNEMTASFNETTTVSLGLLGSFGFLGLIAYIFLKNSNFSTYPLMGALAHFNLAAIMLGTVGGFSSLIAFSLCPTIRCYNRISIFIGFFALTALFLFLQEKIKNFKFVWVLSLAILIFGLWNQSPRSLFSQRKLIKKLYKEDQAFIQKIENQLSPGSMIFQLPYIPFPEGTSTQMAAYPLFRNIPHNVSYEHFKAALHSHSLKWSFGAIRGRNTDLWQQYTSNLDTQSMLEELKKKGFSGLYIDKRGYLDRGESIEHELSQLLDITPIVDDHRSFWDLR